MRTDPPAATGAQESAVDIRFEGVEKSFGAVTAVRDISLSIRHGTFFSLLGPSGCGKTTTLRLIAGFERPSKGSIWIRGHDVTAVPPYRRDFAMVFQNFALFPHLSVAENVAFGLRMRKVPAKERAQRVQEALDLVKLSGYGDRYSRQLSGGQQQRVALARAIVVRPAVLLLDEPLGALDKNLREEMQIELRELQRGLGITTVFVTHDQEEALTLSDEVAVMNHGIVVQRDAPRALYERPQTEFIASFLGTSNFFDAKVVDRDGHKAVVEIPGMWLSVDSAVPVGARVRLAVRPENVRMLRSEGAGKGLPARIREIVYRGSTTDVFLHSEAGPIIVYLQNSDESASAWRVGDSVVCEWKQETCVVLSEE